MKFRPDLEKKVQDTLDSLDGIQRAEPRPYFYTRLTARLQSADRTIWEAMGSFLSRPVVAVAGLCFILILNAFALLRQDTGMPVSVPVANSTEQLATDNEYILASSSSFDYENLDQQ